MLRFITNLFRRTDNYNDSVLNQLRSGGVATVSSVRVNETTAMNLVAVYAAIRALSEDIASVPFPVYKRLKNGGKDRDRSHPVYRLLNESPDGEISAMQWREYQVKCLNLYGNAYNELEISNAGDVIGIHRINPADVEVKRLPSGEVVYRVAGAGVEIPRNRMLHIAGLGDGLVGLSPIKHARQTIAAGLMMDQFTSAWFANGSRGSMALSHPGKLSPEAQETLREQLADVHGGPTNAGKVYIFEEGMTPHQLSVPAEEAQFLGSRTFTVQEIARLFRVPCSMLQENSNSAVRANTEQEAINYVAYSLRPWMVRIESEINRKLFREDERETYFAEHLIDAIMRGEATTRTAALKDQFLNGALTHDEWRSIENRNPLPDGLGSLHYVPLNMTTVDRMAEDDPEEDAPEDVPEVPAEEIEDDTEATEDVPAEDDTEDVESIEQSEEKPQPAPDIALDAARMGLEDAIARMIRREANAINRAANKPRQFLQAVEDFYGRHQPVLSESITPPLRTLIAVKHGGRVEYDADDVEGFSLDVAEQLCEMSKAELLELSGDVTADDLKPAIQARTGEWLQSRPADIVRQLSI